MAIIPESQYPGKIAPASTEYPYGQARNITLPGDGTGTPWEAALVNDLFGFQQALLEEAGIVPSGDPETATESQYLAAAKKVIGGDKTIYVGSVAELEGLTPELFATGQEALVLGVPFIYNGTSWEPSQGYITPDIYGAVGAGTETAEFQAALDTGYDCYVLDKTYTVDFLSLAEGQKIYGAGTILAASAGPESLIELNNNSGISGITVDCNGLARRAIGGLKKTGIYIKEDVKVTGSLRATAPGSLIHAVQLLDCSEFEIDGISVENSESGILLLKCRYGSVDSAKFAGLLNADRAGIDIFFDSFGITIDGVQARENTRFPVRWAGGDAADAANKDVWVNNAYSVTDYFTYDSLATSHAAVYGLTVSNVTMIGTGNRACVWGKKGQGITVTNCYSDECEDVAFDAETCRDVTFTNCISKNAAFGGLATFYYGNDISFVNCHSWVDDPTILNLAQFKGATDAAGTDRINVKDCSFESRNGQLGRVLIERGPKDTFIKNNTFYNCQVSCPIQKTAPAVIEVSNNDMRFDVSGNYNAVYLLATQDCTVEDNDIRRSSAESSPTESNAAIYSTKNNNQLRPQVRFKCKNNDVSGWANSIVTDAASDADGAFAYFDVTANRVSGAIKNKELKTDGITPFTRFNYYENENRSLNGSSAVAKAAY